MPKANNVEPHSERFVGLSDGAKKALTLIIEGESILSSLTKDYSTVQNAINSYSTTRTDNGVKLQKADSDKQKEENRHNEEMKKHEIALEKLAMEAAERGKDREFIKSNCERLQAQYDRYLSMDDEGFLSPVVTQRLERLDRIFSELAKEYLK